MSHSGKPVTELGLSERLRDSLSCSDDSNKPDFRELDLGSPVSTLRPRQHFHHHSAPTTSNSSSSSGGSTGSVPGRSNPVSGRSHSGELSGSSETNSPTRMSKPGHRRSNSSQSFSQSQRSPSSSSAAVNSPPLNVLPAGNICPSGRVLKAATVAPVASRSSRSDVLGSGTGNYGHGSIMRGGKGGGGNTGGGDAASVKIGGGDSGKRVDPEEVKRMGNEEYKRGHFAEALCLYDRAIAMSPGNAAYRSNRAAALTGLGRLPEAVRACEEAVGLDPNYGRAHQRLATLFLRWIWCVCVCGMTLAKLLILMKTRF